MKRVILTGGIGNQLFKSLGAIQASNGDLHSICFDVSWYQAGTFTNGKTASRKFELAEFPAFSEVPLKVRNPVLSRIESRLINSHPKLMEQIGYQFNSSPRKRNLISTRVYKCDFEDYTALPSEHTILNYLRFPKTSSSWSQEIREAANKENVIAVHVRRNDYLTFSDIYPKLGLPYYIASIKHIRSKLGNLPIWLFSDDPTGVIQEFGKKLEFDRVINPPPEVSMVEVLELFSLMNGVVTANSTFSWWGAYLGSIRGNVEEVTIPEKFTSLESDPGLRLRTPGWKIIAS
jgi:hypothetical protein